MFGVVWWWIGDVSGWVGVCVGFCGFEMGCGVV